MYYHNTRIESTKIQTLCTLKISFDIVFDDLFNRGYHPIQPLQNVRIHNIVITKVKNRSPDMILMGFDRKFHEKKDDLPPEACRPLKKLEKNNVGPDRTGFGEPDLFAERTGPDFLSRICFLDRTGPARTGSSLI